MTFSTLSRRDVEAACEEFGVGELRDFAAIAAGTINSNHRVDAARGRYFLRVNEGKVEADVAYEAELVGELASAGVPTPRLQAARDGRHYAIVGDRLLSMFAWVDGDHRAAGQVTSSDAAQVGGALARLHAAGAPIADRYPRDGIYTFDHIVRRLESFRDSSDPALAPAIAALTEEATWLSARADTRAAAPRGVIHGDLFRDNVMFDGPRLVALIDFEQASIGSFVYDLSVCINDWCYAGALDLGLAAEMVQGYRAVRPLAPAEIAALWIELRAAAMRFTVTRITDVYLPGVSRAGKDFREYLDRLARWRALGEPAVQTALGL
jgi:homoserine kinase type II